MSYADPSEDFPSPREPVGGPSLFPHGEDSCGARDIWGSGHLPPPLCPWPRSSSLPRHGGPRQWISPSSRIAQGVMGSLLSTDPWHHFSSGFNWPDLNVLGDERMEFSTCTRVKQDYGLTQLHRHISHSPVCKQSLLELCSVQPVQLVMAAPRAGPWLQGVPSVCQGGASPIPAHFPGCWASYLLVTFGLIPCWYHRFKLSLRTHPGPPGSSLLKNLR